MRKFLTWLKNHKEPVIIISVVFILVLVLVISYTPKKEPNKSQPAPTITTSSPGWKTYEQAVKDGDIPPAEKILEVTLNYDATASSLFKLVELTQKNGYITPPEPDTTPNTIQLLEENKNVLYEQKFTVANRQVDESSGVQTLQKLQLILALPWHDNVRWIRINYDNKGREDIILMPVSKIAYENNKPQFDRIKGEDITSARGQTAFNFDFLAKQTYAQAAGGKKINVVLVSNYYTSGEEQLFKDFVQKATGYLMTLEPYKTRSSQFAFNVIFTTELSACGNTNDAGCFPEVEKFINSRGAPYNVWGLINKGPDGGVAQFFKSFVSESSEPWGTHTFAHEFSHAFAGLSDEYVRAEDQQAKPEDLKVFSNCWGGKPPAEVWKGLVSQSDYRLGCTYKNWHAPSQESLMKQHRIEGITYNKVSLCIVNKRIDLAAGNWPGGNPAASFCPKLKLGDPKDPDKKLYRCAPNESCDDPDFNCISQKGKCQPKKPEKKPEAKKPEANKNCDTAKYAADIQKNPLKKNFGDPNCDFTKDGLYKLLKEQDPANADKWFNTIVPCESSYNPNAYHGFDGSSPDQAGAWGLYQMGQGKNGPSDHGDVEWKQQTSNAVNYNKNIGGSFAYWGCNK